MILYIMRKTYNDILLFIEMFVVKLQTTKMWLAESYALIKKRHLIKSVKWNTKQLNEFNAFWKNNYGKKISSKGVKLYESINDVYCVDYFPDKLFATKLEPKLNPYYYAKIFGDKSLTEILYAKSKLVKFPETYLVNSGGILYDGKRQVISEGKAKEILSSLTEVVIKPTVGGNSGKGVMVCSFKNGYDAKNNLNISQLLDNKKVNFIIQEKMKQHKTVSTIYPNSVNTFRTITYVIDGNVYCADLALRIGSGGGNVDNIHAGGLGIGVENDGSLLKYAFKLGYSETRQKFEKHPDSGIIFQNYKIIGIDKIIECAKELHGLTPHLRMISWDFMVSEDGSPVLIEANYLGQAVWFTQIVHGKPFFGKQTVDMLKTIGRK